LCTSREPILCCRRICRERHSLSILDSDPGLRLPKSKFQSFTVLCRRGPEVSVTVAALTNMGCAGTDGQLLGFRRVGPTRFRHRFRGGATIAAEASSQAFALQSTCADWSGVMPEKVGAGSVPSFTSSFFNYGETAKTQWPRRKLISLWQIHRNLICKLRTSARNGIQFD